MSKSNLIPEAIADAQALKESVIENVKEELIELIKPSIHKQVSSLIEGKKPLSESSFKPTMKHAEEEPEEHQEDDEFSDEHNHEDGHEGHDEFGGEGHDEHDEFGDEGHDEEGGHKEFEDDFDDAFNSEHPDGGHGEEEGEEGQEDPTVPLDDTDLGLDFDGLDSEHEKSHEEDFEDSDFDEIHDDNLEGGEGDEDENPALLQDEHEDEDEDSDHKEGEDFNNHDFNGDDEGSESDDEEPFEVGEEDEYDEHESHEQHHESEEDFEDDEHEPKKPHDDEDEDELYEVFDQLEEEAAPKSSNNRKMIKENASLRRELDALKKEMQELAFFTNKHRLVRKLMKEHYSSTTEKIKVRILQEFDKVHSLNTANKLYNKLATIAENRKKAKIQESYKITKTKKTNTSTKSNNKSDYRLKKQKSLVNESLISAHRDRNVLGDSLSVNSRHELTPKQINETFSGWAHLAGLPPKSDSK